MDQAPPPAAAMSTTATSPTGVPVPQAAATQAGFQGLEPAPPPLPTPPQQGYGTLIILIVVVAACAWFYYIRQQTVQATQKAAQAQAEAASAQVQQKMTAAQKEQNEKDMKTCEADKKRQRHGKCQVDPKSNSVSLYCDDGRYGTNCEQRCATGGISLLKYTSGFEGGAASAATCECPAENHFQNTDPSSGCRRGFKCADDYHGDECTGKGDKKDCKNGSKQSKTTGECECTADFTGPECQYKKTRCGKGGTLDDSSGECTCEEGYEGDLCEKCIAPYEKQPDGSCKKAWSGGWKKVEGSVTFSGGERSIAGCTTCHDGDPCDSTVNLCDLLQRKSKADQGQNMPYCTNPTSLCGNAHNSSRTYGLVSSSGTVTNGHGKQCTIKSSCSGNWNNGNFLASVKIPEGVHMKILNDDTCNGESVWNQAGPGTFTQSKWQSAVSFETTLTPGYYTTCADGTTLRGAAKAGSVPAAGSIKISDVPDA